VLKGSLSVRQLEREAEEWNWSCFQFAASVMPDYRTLDHTYKQMELYPNTKNLGSKKIRYVDFGRANILGNKSESFKATIVRTSSVQ